MTLPWHGIPLYSSVAAPREDDQAQPLAVAGSAFSSTKTWRQGPAPASWRAWSSFCVTRASSDGAIGYLDAARTVPIKYPDSLRFTWAGHTRTDIPGCTAYPSPTGMNRRSAQRLVERFEHHQRVALLDLVALANRPLEDARRDGAVNRDFHPVRAA